MIIKPSPRLAGSVRRVLVSVGLGATLVLGSAGAASAGTWSFDDPTGDVMVTTEDDFGDYEPAPERVVGDVRRVSVSHMQSKLVMRLTLRQNLPSSDWGIYELIRTPRAMFGVIIHRYEGGGFVGLSKFTEDGGRVRCSGLAITYAPRSVQISIPTRCLGTPRVVRVGATVDMWSDEDSYYEDDALRRGISEWGPRFSPQIPRG